MSIVKLLLIIGIVVFMGAILWMGMRMPQNPDRPEE
jgi:hypothetical protein